MKPIHCLATLCVLISTSAFAGQIRTDDQAIKRALYAVHKYRLTTLSDDCILVDASELPAYFDITLREHHSQSCGGDPQTGPRLFNIRVRKRDGRLTSDAYDGTTYKPVDRKITRSR